MNLHENTFVSMTPMGYLDCHETRVWSVCGTPDEDLEMCDLCGNVRGDHDPRKRKGYGSAIFCGEFRRSYTPIKDEPEEGWFGDYFVHLRQEGVEIENLRFGGSGIVIDRTQIGNLIDYLKKIEDGPVKE